MLGVKRVLSRIVPCAIEDSGPVARYHKTVLAVLPSVPRAERRVRRQGASHRVAIGVVDRSVRPGGNPGSKEE